MASYALNFWIACGIINGVALELNRQNIWQQHKKVIGVLDYAQAIIAGPVFTAMSLYYAVIAFNAVRRKR